MDTINTLPGGVDVDDDGDNAARFTDNPLHLVSSIHSFTLSISVYFIVRNGVLWKVVWMLLPLKKGDFIL